MGNLKAATANPPTVLDAISPYILPQEVAGQQPTSKRRRQAIANLPGMQIPSSFEASAPGMMMGVQSCGLPLSMNSVVSGVDPNVKVWAHRPLLHYVPDRILR
jgi:hypothetical protein